MRAIAYDIRPSPKDDLMRLMRSLLALLIFALFAAHALADDARTPKELCDAAEPAPLTMMQFEAAERVLEPNVDYRAIFCTSAGAIYVDLYENLTPITVNSFVFLARQGYYDNTTFHRVIPDFMAQGGDPTGTGRGGPGYRFQDEPVGFLKFDLRYKLAMANAGPGTNGSQFFITTALAQHLNYKHTIFGNVLSNHQIVDRIRERDPATATEPGETLLTVLITTDDQVEETQYMTYMAVERKATREAVIKEFERVAGASSTGLSIDDERSGHFSTEALAASAVPADLQDGFASFAAEYGHLYRQRLQLVNGDCDPSIYFSSLGFWVDVYPDAASARAAAESEFMQLWLDSYGYELDAAEPTVYRLAATTCDGDDSVALLSLSARGRFLLTVDVLVSRSILDQLPEKALLDNLTWQIDWMLARIFAGEMHQRLPES